MRGRHVVFMGSNQEGPSAFNDRSLLPSASGLQSENMTMEYTMKQTSRVTFLNLEYGFNFLPFAMDEI